jgi:hypothetical protein
LALLCTILRGLNLSFPPLAMYLKDGSGKRYFEAVKTAAV